MPSESTASVTRLLQEWQNGEAAAADRLVPLVYAELRRLAAGYIRAERSTAARDLLVREGIEYLDLLSRQSDSDPTLELELAAAYIRLGRFQGSKELFRELLESDRDNVSARRNYARNLLHLSTLHARMSAEISGSASERENHRQRSVSNYELGREVLQSLRAKGTTTVADDDLLADAKAQLDLRAER